MSDVIQIERALANRSAPGRLFLHSLLPVNSSASVVLGGGVVVTRDSGSTSAPTWDQEFWGLVERIRARVGDVSPEEIEAAVSAAAAEVRDQRYGPRCD